MLSEDESKIKKPIIRDEKNRHKEAPRYHLSANLKISLI
jgi:hypothetical protein